VEFKNVSGSPQDLPSLDLRVQPDETFTASGDDAKGLIGNSAFERVDKPSKSSEKE
jgi:hypothetical protein